MSTDDDIDAKWEGIMITYDECDVPGGPTRKRTIPGWKCRGCGYRVGTSGPPPMWPHHCRPNIHLYKIAACEAIRMMHEWASIELKSWTVELEACDAGERGYICGRIEQSRLTVTWCEHFLKALDES